MTLIDIKKHFILPGILLFISGYCFTQPLSYPYELEKKNFVRYDKNKLEYFGDSLQFQEIFKKLETLVFKGKGRINIIHIGGSHIQAGVFSGRMRQRFQNFHYGLNAGRGMVFPNRVARTNTPVDLYVEYTGEWDRCKNTQKRKKCDLGLMGYSVTTKDSKSVIKLYLKNKQYPPHDFNKVRIYHPIAEDIFQPVLQNEYFADRVFTDSTQGFTCFTLKNYEDSVILGFQKTDSLQNRFTLFGIELLTSDPGIIYHGAGVNGASIPCWLRCNLFAEQLAILSPNLVILTLGTNDAYTRRFKPEVYYQNFDSLLTVIRNSAPGVPLLLTVPNDSYLFRRYINKNTLKVRKEIYKLAEKYNAAVWDFFGVMGGLNATSLWYQDGLMKNDKIHFTRPGYVYKADLLFSAFLRAFENYLETNRKTGKTKAQTMK